MEFNIPEISLILEKINNLENIIKTPSEITGEWFNDEQCWRLKGGMALNTYRTNRFYQCKGGIPDAYVGGRKVWSRSSVFEWLPLSDDKLEAYHSKYKTGAKRK